MKHLRLIAFGLLSLGLLMGGINGALSFKTRAFAQGASLPKVNVPFFSGEIPFPEMAVFWFGRITPTENFVDVRVGYNPQHIYIYVAVIDRLLWYDTTPSADDLTNWDAVTLYLSVAEANTIGPHAYRFVAQLNAFTENTADYQQGYRGTSTGGWTPVSINFTTEAGWRGNAPNDLENDRGWAMNFYIPFTSLGLSGRPASQTRWRLAVVVHDRDDPGGTPIPDKFWPPTFSSTNPLTWGVLSFGLPTYTPPAATPGGTVTIRDMLNGAVVPDAGVGGTTPNLCPGDEEYIWNQWGNDNFGNEPDFNIQNQSDIADWPCFSKYYITFPLDQIPPGKVILSATLKIYQFGNSGGPGEAGPSLIQVFTVDSPWDEETITWNNAPLASENVSQAWVPTILPDEWTGWPGVSRTFDVSLAVARAYSAGQPLRLALYEADNQYHSGKYFVSSDTGDWNEEGRPTLTVVWGNPTSSSSGNSEWTQHAHDAQRTSYTNQVVALPWRWKWAWNGPTSSGGISSGKFGLPRNSQPVTGGGRVYIAAGSRGVYALNNANGSVVWNRTFGSAVNSTPAYDPDTNALFVVAANGTLYKLNSATGATVGQFSSDSSSDLPLPPAVISDRVFFSMGTRVYAINKQTMTQLWAYNAGAAVHTPPAYSPSRNRVIVVTEDLYVHAIDNATGTQVWRVKPTPRTGGDPGENNTNVAEVKYGWPVIAEGHGYVLVKLRLDWHALWVFGPWPPDNATMRSNLQSRPEYQALFVLDLDDGSVPFIANVGHAGFGDGGYLPMGPQPVVKRYPNGDELVYTVIRGSDCDRNDPACDGRWDSSFGEMVLDDTTVPGYLAGYVRFIRNTFFPTDEQAYVSMAGNYMFGGHWEAGIAHEITDRSPSRGTFANPIVTTDLPHIATSQDFDVCGTGFSSTHYCDQGLVNTRNWPAGFYIYWQQGNVYDQYWSEYATWVVSNDTIYFVSTDGAVVALEGSTSSSTGAIFRVTREGNVYADGQFIGGGADLAEKIRVSEPVEPGDVVELDPHQPGAYRKSRRPYSPLAAGVISSAPGFVIGLEDITQMSWTPSLALAGVVPVKATTENGPIRVGDLLTTSSLSGYAMRCPKPQDCEGALIGKALQPLAESQGIILMLVMR
jgi:outer membrane protein assembly factor BamB